MKDYKNKLLLIGGIPSSGSTYLVKLISKIERFICLPETGLFTQGHLLNKVREYQPIKLRSNVTWIDISTKIKNSLGISLSQQEIKEKDFNPILYLQKWCSAISDNKIIVEKTPENIFAFDYYLSADPTHKVIITVRNVHEVCASLLKRNFNFHEALLLWFSHAYEAWYLTKHYASQVMLLNYEEIVTSPLDVLQHINFFIDDSKIHTQTVTSEDNVLSSNITREDITTAYNMNAQILENRS